MNTAARICLCSIAIGLAPIAPSLAKSQVKGVKAELISEAATITAGQTFTVALFLHHFDKFHTYWQNPGNVGVPTTIKWDLPDGFSAGPIQWQVPERSKMLVYNCHAYIGDAYLLVNITAPATLPEGPVTLTANTSWMSCSQKTCCFIAFEKVAVTLATGPASKLHPQHAQDIANARKRLPHKDPNWIVNAATNKKHITLQIRHKTQSLEQEDLYFYPFEKVSDTELPQHTTVDGAAYTLTVPQASHLESPPNRIRGLLYRPSGWSSPEQKHLPIDVQVSD